MISEIKELLAQKNVCQWQSQRSAIASSAELQSDSKCSEALKKAIDDFERINKVTTMAKPKSSLYTALKDA
jgi:hypothetical protein